MRKLVFILFAAMLATAACGGDSGDDVAAASKKGEAAKGAGDDPASRGEDGANFCEYLTDLQENEDELNLSGENNAEQQEKAKKGLEVLGQLEEKAPTEIKADVVVIIKQVKPFFEALAGGKDYKPDPAEQPTDLQSKEFEEAGKRVQAYATDVCGIKDEKPPADEQAPAEQQVPLEREGSTEG